MRRLFALGLTLSIFAIAAASPAEGRRRLAPADQTSPAEALPDAAAALMGRALASDRAWERLVELCDGIGHRLSGSPALDLAIEWAEAAMKADGLDAVRAEPVMVPRWLRGEEAATMLHPVVRSMPILGLGNSVGTLPEGIEADVVVVGSFDELRSLGDSVAGKIVLYDVPFTTYGATVQYRTKGADAASLQGAVAALVRSVTTDSLSTPHTGTLRYLEATRAVPAAAVTVEDATRMRRLQDRGITPRVRLVMGAQMDGEARSANVVGEVRGRTRPEEIVVIACHLDSWDVGTGAQDDGAGCVVAMEAARLIGTLERRPARTVRVVLYTNEENGLAGGRAYAEAHREELERHVAAIESDTGAGEPLGYRIQIAAPDAEASEQPSPEQTRALKAMQNLATLLEPIGATTMEAGFSGADIRPIVLEGVPGLGQKHDMSGYWPIHHTEADTIDKIDPMALRRNVASMAIMAYALADRDGRITD